MIKVNKDAFLEYEHLKQNDLFSTVKSNAISCDNNENKFLSLAYWCKNDIADLNKFDANGVSILSFRKHPCTCKTRIFSNVAIFSINIFHKYYSKGLQLWSFKSVAK